MPIKPNLYIIFIRISLSRLRLLFKYLYSKRPQCCMNKINVILELSDNISSCFNIQKLSPNNSESHHPKIFVWQIEGSSLTLTTSRKQK